MLQASGSNLTRGAINSGTIPTEAYMVIAFKSFATQANPFTVTEKYFKRPNFTSLNVGAYSSGTWNQSSTGGARPSNCNYTETVNTWAIVSWAIQDNNMFTLLSQWYSGWINLLIYVGNSNTQCVLSNRIAYTCTSR
jgi:hypothetical protein